MEFEILIQTSSQCLLFLCILPAHRLLPAQSIVSCDLFVDYDYFFVDFLVGIFNPVALIFILLCTIMIMYDGKMMICSCHVTPH